MRYNWDDSYTSNFGAVANTGFAQPRVNKNTLVGYTHTLTPSLHNDFRIGYHRIDFDTINNFMVDGVPSAGTDLGIPGFDADTRYGNPGIPSITVTGFSGLGAGGKAEQGGQRHCAESESVHGVSPGTVSVREGARAGRARRGQAIGWASLTTVTPGRTLASEGMISTQSS